MTAYHILNKMRRLRNPLTQDVDNGELALLERIRRHAARSSGKELRLGIGDDCALIRIKPGEEIAITTDLSIAGRHFRLEWHPPEVVGHRTLARGLSDIAAMGARPVAAFLSLGLPRELTLKKGNRPPWIDGFLDGFLALAAKHKTPLAGGDLAQSPLAAADIVLVGAVPRAKALLRSGARPGDLLYVTGALGGAAAGLDQLKKRNPKTPSRDAKASNPGDGLAQHLWPQPRIPQGLWLSRRGAATAAIDISDGLSTDLDHLCVESEVSAEVVAASLPVYPGASLEEALHGGEDYELLFSATAGTRIPRRIANVPVTPIGRIVKARALQPRIVLLTSTGRQPLSCRGWQHFS